MMKENTSKIDQFMRVKGEVVSRGTLIIEGELRGSFQGGSLIVADSGRMVGEVQGESIKCSGHIEGNVVTNSLTLKKGGCQVGTVVTGELEVESGALIDCILHSGSGCDAIPYTAVIPESEVISVDLEKYLKAFDESHRPCCFEVPWSERLGLYKHVVDLLRKDKPLIKIVGDAGSGKTAFVQKLLVDTFDNVEIVELLEKVGSVTTLLKEVSESLRVKNSKGLSGQAELVGQIRKELLRRNAAGESVVLVIDDAEKMYQATLEGIIRLLSGVCGGEEVDSAEYLQIILLGEPEVKANMVATILDYFEDETNCQLTLDPLSMKDTADYLRLGLQLAFRGEDVGAVALLPNETIKEIHVRSNGLISDINLLMVNALHMAHKQGESTLSPGFIKKHAGR